MERFKEAILDLQDRMVNAGETIPASILFLEDANEEEAKAALSTMLDKEYDIVLDYFYSLLPSQGSMIIHDIVAENS